MYTTAPRRIDESAEAVCDLRRIVHRLSPAADAQASRQADAAYWDNERAAER